jgi:RHS repeat-associated protein
VAWQWLISGFGEVRPTTGDRGYGQTVSGPSYAEAVKFDLRYPGQVFDEETGLSYNLHRYYDAATGRYIQADPIGLEGGWNRYSYVGSNPFGAADPLGLFEVKGYPSTTFDKRKYPANVQELYRYAAQLQDLLKKSCPGSKRAQELFDSWVVTISTRWADPVTNYRDRTTDFTAPFFDEKSYGFGKPSPAFVFMHEFMHLTDSNYAKSRATSTAEYINAFTRGTSNDLPLEKHADQLVRDLMNGKCSCE